MKQVQINKKGQVGGLYAGVLTIASIGILLVILMYVIPTIGDSTSTTATGTVANETGFINATTYTLDKVDARNFASPVITVVLNATDNATIAAGNYSLSNAGVLSKANANSVNWSSVRISYTYTYSTDTTTYNATQTLTNQFIDFLPWVGIILLVLAAGVVLFFVVRSFGGNKGV